jgi:hypothetical protein
MGCPVALARDHGRIWMPAWKTRSCFSSDSGYRWFVIGRLAIVLGALMTAAGYLVAMLT